MSASVPSDSVATGLGMRPLHVPSRMSPSSSCISTSVILEKSTGSPGSSSEYSRYGSLPKPWSSLICAETLRSCTVEKSAAEWSMSGASPGQSAPLRLRMTMMKSLSVGVFSPSSAASVRS